MIFTLAALVVIMVLTALTAVFYGKYAELDRRYGRLKSVDDELERVGRELAAQREEKERVLYGAQREKDNLLDDARREAGAMIREAGKDVDKLRKEARAEVRAELDARRQRLKAREETLKAKAVDIDARERAIIGRAEARAKSITDKAYADAIRTAGDAFEARGKKDQYEALLAAIESTINGYGNKYLIPGRNLLDELADGYSFQEAGKKLKDARDFTRSLVERRLAGDCDYAEPGRKNAAIDFAVDAFNGKVDTILEDVKSDNYGILAQRIDDAFRVINHVGAPFRNARITQPYLHARQEELKHAVIVYELREKEREEQRAIREQMREEEKARRDQERALQEAAKQEADLQKAMEMARAQIELATEEERAQYEIKLRELSAKLKEAEEKAQRAKSMAELTKAGHVYIISNIGSFGEDVIKIGMTRRLDPMDRVYELGDASVPFPFDVHGMIYSEDAPKLEQALHRKFGAVRVNKVNNRKEFFRVGLSAIKTELDALDLRATFTLKAEALEYRESLAVDNLPDDAKAKLLGQLEEEKADAVGAASGKEESDVG